MHRNLFRAAAMFTVLGVATLSGYLSSPPAFASQSVSCAPITGDCSEKNAYVNAPINPSCTQGVKYKLTAQICGGNSQTITAWAFQPGAGYGQAVTLTATLVVGQLVIYEGTTRCYLASPPEFFMILDQWIQSFCVEAQCCTE